MRRSGFLRAVLFAFTLLGCADASGTGDTYSRNVAVVIYDGVELLDFAGAAQALEIGGQYGAAEEEPAYRLFSVGPVAESVRSANFLSLQPDYAYPEAPVPDVLLIPGGNWKVVTEDSDFMEWIRRAGAGAVTLAVCTGNAIAAQAGLLDGRRATSWHQTLDQMQARFPDVEFVGGLPYVDSGSVVSAASASQGIDAALHLVARSLGRHVAEEASTYLGHDWVPDARLARDYHYLNPRLGERERRLQQARIYRRSGELQEAAALYRRLLADRADDGGLWYELGKSLAAAGEYGDAIEAHVKAARSDGLRPNALYNAACAAALDGDKERALDFLQQSVDAGFRYPDYLSKDTDLAAIRDNPRFEPLVEQARRNRGD